MVHLSSKTHLHQILKGQFGIEAWEDDAHEIEESNLQKDVIQVGPKNPRAKL